MEIIVGFYIFKHLFVMFLFYTCKDFRSSSLFMFCMMWIWIIVIITCSFLQWTSEEMERTAFILLALTWLTVLLESCYCAEMQYLKKLGGLTYAEEFFKKMKGGQPEVLFKVSCYHYESYPKGGDKKKVTFTGSERFEFSRWEDVTEDRINIEQQGVTRVHLFKTFVCGDPRTQQQFDRQFELLKLKHKNKDVHVDAGVSLEVAQFVKRVTVTANPDGMAPWWMSAAIFIFCTSIGFSFPYRWMFTRMTKKCELNIVKKIYK